MKRLLCLLSSMNAGGAETFLMKVYRQLDKQKYQMDFCINVREKCFYEDEILSMGGKIFRIPAKSENLKEFKKQLTAIVKREGYQHVLRITSNCMGFLDLKIAKKAGATVCCARSSNSSDGGSFKAWISHRLGRLLYGRYVNVSIAPSDLAAKYTFGNRAYRQGKVHLLHNAVDLNVFCYSEKARYQIRKEFGIADDVKVVGLIGRFSEQKNHRFLIDVFNEYQKKCEKAVLMLVGKGELENEIRQRVADCNITDKVIFTGVRSDVPDLLSAMDVFVMPSFYEGMPNTVIEAQATGLPCVIADTITREADITGLVKYLPLQDTYKWVQNIMDSCACSGRIDTKDFFISKQYDIDSVTKGFTKIIFGE